jgi:DNA-directed RNA polymerase III subunit RPC4
MPPKKARGGARGGRGRGGSSGPAAPPPAEELDQPFKIQISNSSSAANRVEPLTTPEKTTHEGDRMDLDPNDSPATQPTETPASTPLRPPSSLQMQSADSQGGVPSRGGTRGRAKESKFKPKNVRRSASELKALADQESERVAAAAANAAKLRGRGNAFRARAGRGRGDAMGRGRGTSSSVASGPFAVAPEIGMPSFLTHQPLELTLCRQKGRVCRTGCLWAKARERT